jgi:hypothetical protein
MTTSTIRPAAVLCSAVILAIAGCSGANDCTLAGKVTYQGKPVICGTVIVVGADGIRQTGRIDSDGTYFVEKLVAGPVKISVESPAPENPADRPARPPRPEGPAERPPDYKPPDRAKWVRLPGQYADPDQSGLTTTVSSGKNPFDIPLK